MTHPGRTRISLREKAEEKRGTGTGRHWAPCSIFAVAVLVIPAPPALAEEVGVENAHGCHAHMAGAPLADARVWKIGGDVRFRMAGVEFEALAGCPSAADEGELGFVQIVTDYRIEAQYETGRIQVRILVDYFAMATFPFGTRSG